VSVQELHDRIARLRQRAGRRVPVTLFSAIPSMLADFAEAGVDRCLFTLRSGPGDLDQLDQWAAQSAGQSFD
jgi:hypothetical protein